MKLWMRKITVVLVTIMTLGLYVPPLSLDVDADENKDTISSDSDSYEVASPPISDIREEELDFPHELDEDDYFIQVITEKAKERTITKLGSKITNQIEDDFLHDILLNMEEALHTILAESGKVQYFGITEHPSKGLGEKIFNIYDYRTHKDVARFHVRRDNRPLEGYWFNFHYHLSNDSFEEHHEIGEIYWNKNIPPKWMA
ncbi:hypothetical protein CIL05_03040 [Virgibacillus profundi]|uniref:YpjP-like protein n=1 Tax=Virgibacillus profundi TaxID=2024555 RepID=A0A2A2IJT3_9BACI|nr:YpjP family protein [Virgibacillus profundi]PAV31648.1 hypothetical protein CIL05_03040 [Virgibacillus profundi]PXY55834.1 hypothetical protein CIT14_03050 [Virgibacillus profundi]